MATMRAQDYTFVTNNRSDFLALHGQEPDMALRELSPEGAFRSESRLPLSDSP
jgi:hypothetical protein